MPTRELLHSDVARVSLDSLRAIGPLAMGILKHAGGPGANARAMRVTWTHYSASLRGSDSGHRRATRRHIARAVDGSDTVARAPLTSSTASDPEEPIQANPIKQDRYPFAPSITLVAASSPVILAKVGMHNGRRFARSTTSDVPNYVSTACSAWGPASSARRTRKRATMRTPRASRSSRLR